MMFMVYENMLELAMGWPQIESFDIHGTFAFQKITVVGIKNMVKHAKKLNYLRLDGHINSCIIDVNNYEEMVQLIQN